MTVVPTSKARIAYLDNLRFALVALVVPLHAYYIGFAEHRWITVFHDSFHMAALFLISGYFAAPAVQKLGASRFVTTRGRALLPPLLFILSLSLPTLAMHQYLKSGTLDGYASALSNAVASGNILLHGWFLAALLVFVLLAGSIDTAIKSERLRALASKVPSRYIGLALVGIAFVTAWPAEILWSGSVGPLALPLFVYEALRYFWAFALGLACWHAPALFQALHKIDPLIVLIALLAWALTLIPLGLSNAEWEAAWALRRVTSALVLIPACLWLFQSVLNFETPLTRALSEAGMTVFVSQWALLYVFALTLPLGFWGLSALALVTGLALHHLIVKRSSFASEWIAGIRRADPPSYA